MPSDSNYASVTRYTRRSTGANFFDDKLSDDEVEIERHVSAVAPLLEEGELDAEAIVVSPTGNSASAANNGNYR